VICDIAIGRKSIKVIAWM